MNSYQTGANVRRNRTSKSNNTFGAFKFSAILVVALIVAVVWIKKENWNSVLSQQYLMLQTELREAEGLQMNLTSELAELSRVTDVQAEAHRLLGMQPTRERPDTIWVKDAEVPVLMSSLSFYGL